MAAPPKTLNGKIVLQCYMLDNSYKTLLIEPHSTVQDVCRSMAEKIGLEDPEDDSLCFSLNECLDGAIIGRALPADKEVMGIMEGWVGKPEARFVFQCKLYTDGIIKSTDPKVVQLLFIQGVYNIISGTYPSTDKDAVQLAAWQFQAKFGPHNPASHRAGFLSRSIQEYVPAPHLHAVPVRPTESWEDDIFRKHAFSTTQIPREAYLSALSQRDYYGAVLFVVKQSYTRAHPKKLFLGISRRGILLLRIPKTPTDGVMETLAKYPLADIYRWAYKPSVNFYFEIKAEDSTDEHPIHTFETVEGKHMSDMLTDYAMALLREMGLNADGTKRIRPRDRLAATVAAAGGVAAPPSATPGIASSADSYKGVSGDVGSLATAAVRSGEYGPDAGAAAGVGSAPPPPPPPAFAPPPPPPVEPVAAAPPAAVPGEAPLPAGWTKVLDESSGDYYYFNTSSGESVWERDEIPGINA